MEIMPIDGLKKQSCYQSIFEHYLVSKHNKQEHTIADQVHVRRLSLDGLPSLTAMQCKLNYWCAVSAQNSAVSNSPDRVSIHVCAGI
jgi:hypothetical protein